MKNFPRTGIALCAFSLVMMITSSTSVNAESDQRGGPCGGASAPSQKVQVHVVGKQARQTVKVIGHFESDVDGDVIGGLIVGQGALQLEVTNWCRIWTSEKTSSGLDSVTHIVGTKTDADGREVFVRVDVRTDEGGKVRVRTRATSGHDSHVEASEADEEHGGWKSVTGEGWVSVTRLRLK